MEPFYIIWSPQGKTPPIKQFKFRWEADKVARHMAKIHVGQDFFVMKAKSNAKVVIPEPTVEYSGRWRPRKPSIKPEPFFLDEFTLYTRPTGSSEPWVAVSGGL